MAMVQMNPIAEKQPMLKWVYQLLATFIANLCALAQGCNIGWTSPSIPILQSQDSPLTSGPLSVSEAAWVVSILPIASIAGTIAVGISTNYIGSKRSLLMCAFPAIVCWIATWQGTHLWHLYVARIASGLCGGGVFIAITMFVAEIASDNIRGRLSALLQFFFNTGIMLGFVAGTMLEYRTVPLVIMVFPIAFICIFVWFPDTPQHLVKLNQLKKAESSLRFYRNCPKNDQGDDELKEELAKFLAIAKQNKDMPPTSMGDFLTPDALRGLIIGPTLMAIAQFSGTFMMSNYAATIFSASGSTINANVSSIILGCIQVIGTIVASALIDRVGRRILLLVSCAGSTVSLVITGIYSYLSTNHYDLIAWNVVPIISLSAFIFISAIGLTPVPYVVLTEVLPQKIRRIGATFGVVSVSVFAFIMLRIFPVLLDSLGLYWCMWMCACVSMFGFFFTLFVVRETTGVNLDQIIDSDIRNTPD